MHSVKNTLKMNAEIKKRVGFQRTCLVFRVNRREKVSKSPPPVPSWARWASAKSASSFVNDTKSSSRNDLMTSRLRRRFLRFIPLEDSARLMPRISFPNRARSALQQGREYFAPYTETDVRQRAPCSLTAEHRRLPIWVGFHLGPPWHCRTPLPFPLASLSKAFRRRLHYVEKDSQLWELLTFSHSRRGEGWCQQQKWYL